MRTKSAGNRISPYLIVILLIPMLLSACTPTPAAPSSTQATGAAGPQTSVSESLLDKVKRTKALVIGTGSYPPSTMVDAATGEWVGYDMDMLIAFAKQLGADPFITYMPASALVPALQSGRIDMWVDLYKTEQRAQVLDFSDVWTCYAQVVVVNSEQPTVTSASVEALKGKKIATCRGCAEEAYIDKIPGAEKVLYETVEQVFLEVSSGRVDAGFQPVLYLGWGQKQNPDWKVKSLGLIPAEIIPDGAQAVPSYFGVVKGETSATFLGELNAFIKGWRGSSNMRDSFARYGLTDDSFFSETCK